MDSKILGIIEKVDFPEFGIKGVKAKIDSGAYTGALHCTNITEEKTKNGSVVHFSPFDYPDIKISSKEFYKSYVRSSNGKVENRYFITTSIYIGGNTFEILLSLADRSSMKRPVLIGRRFLRHNKFLLDVNKSHKKPLIKKV